MEAINDGIYLEGCVYQILKHYIRDKPYYINIVELFHEVCIKSCIPKLYISVFQIRYYPCCKKMHAFYDVFTA